ncbi:UNVERIFIED_CONTAM: hypothetical protein NCL1_46347 [Trichonephila clavipes]
MLMDGNRYTYQMIQKKFNFGFAAIYKIFHEELHTKKKRLKLPNDGDHRVISKIVMDVETYMLFYDVPTRQESKKYGIDQSHQFGRAEDGNSKLLYHHEMSSRNSPRC